MHKFVMIIVASVAITSLESSGMKLGDGYHGAVVLQKSADNEDWLIADRLMVTVQSAKSLMMAKDISSERKHEARVIYASAWASALTAACRFHTAEAEKHVFKQWEADLARQSNIPAMAWALAISGADEKYFTNNLKQTLTNTSSVSVLKSLSYWIAMWGSKGDVALLKKRANEVKSLKLKQILFVALTWRQFRDVDKKEPSGTPVHVQSPWFGDPFVVLGSDQDQKKTMRNNAVGQTTAVRPGSP